MKYFIYFYNLYWYRNDDNPNDDHRYTPQLEDNLQYANPARPFDNNPNHSYDPNPSQDSGNPNQSYDGANPNRSYDGGIPNRGYDGGNPERSYDEGNPNQSYDGNPQFADEPPPLYGSQVGLPMPEESELIYVSATRNENPYGTHHAPSENPYISHPIPHEESQDFYPAPDMAPNDGTNLSFANLGERGHSPSSDSLNRGIERQQAILECVAMEIK